MNTVHIAFIISLVLCGDVIGMQSTNRSEYHNLTGVQKNFKTSASV